MNWLSLQPYGKDGTLGLESPNSCAGIYATLFLWPSKSAYGAGEWSWRKC